MDKRVAVVLNPTFLVYQLALKEFLHHLLVHQRVRLGEHLLGLEEDHAVEPGADSEEVGGAVVVAAIVSIHIKDEIRHMLM